MAILVTGGAGYIGSHTVADLVAAGEQVVVLDNLATGHRAAVHGADVVIGDIRDTSGVLRVLREHDVQAVVHFAASSLVGVSVQQPREYYDNNVAGTLSLLTAMVEADVHAIVFSSTAAVYGEPRELPIPETHPASPTSPYGDTKHTIERMLHWFLGAYGVRSFCLRYFNAAGAHPRLPIGEDHRPETHLVPIVLATALGQRERIPLFGEDYDTPDGTCVRDYVHVCDLARAHRLALSYLQSHSVAEVCNLGTGRGYSNKEVIETARAVTGRAIAVAREPRRPGDPAMLVAGVARAKDLLGWEPHQSELESIIASAWRWHQAHRTGYPD
jgi:UDP-glucose 4-epimerase